VGNAGGRFFVHFNVVGFPTIFSNVVSNRTMPQAVQCAAAASKHRGL